MDHELDTERIDAVLDILKKQSPLTINQEKYCTDSCVDRFLKARGDNVKKAAKHLRAVLSWRDTIRTDQLIADEFSSELAEGLAYVAGYDDDARPVLVFRIKQDYLKFHTQKSYLRFLVFTLEVAISIMSKFVDQFVLLYDASSFRSAPAFLNIYMMTLKVISEYYPGRLHKSFVVDPPSIFSCLWKGSRPFVEQWTATTIVSSPSVDDEPRRDDHAESNILSSYPHRTTSLRLDASPAITKSKGPAAGGGSTSSRFAFTVSHLDSLKPWYLSSVAPAPRAPASAVPTTSSSPSIAAGAKARSFSFASPPSSSMVTPTRGTGQCSSNRQPRTPMPSFLQSPFSFGKKGEKESSRSRESFKITYSRFYTRPYDEMVYRSKMRPPLGGLLSIVSPHLLKQQRRQRIL
ncbi:uncharacterized protein M6B38_282560 [Iris pallida]|uniref:CRAL-TRIO domain-containing protein n=1 Tax=Iris pallida TaxID=29817 RepID=A0AAX6I2F2_IRIPA|nr:uncharacterized protein M6B38_282560 [Iris pallida]